MKMCSCVNDIKNMNNIFNLMETSMISCSNERISHHILNFDKQVDLQGLDGSSGPFEGLDPEISWSASASAGGCDFEVRYGIGCVV